MCMSLHVCLPHGGRYSIRQGSTRVSFVSPEPPGVGAENITQVLQKREKQE